MPYQIDYQMRVPDPQISGGYYYWSNAWIVRASNDSQAVTRLNEVDSAVDQMTLAVVNQVNAQMKRTPGLGGVYNTVNLFNEPGAVPIGDGEYSLLNYVKVNLYVGDELVGYKRWRMPVRQQDITGGLVTGISFSAIHTAFTGLMATATLSARDGRTITSFVVDPRLRMWQLRHGTKRRTGPIFA